MHQFSVLVKKYWIYLLNCLDLLKSSCVLDNSDHTSINTPSLIVTPKFLGILLLQVVNVDGALGNSNTQIACINPPIFAFCFVYCISSICIVCGSFNLKAGWSLIEYWYCDKRSFVVVLSNVREVFYICLEKFAYKWLFYKAYIFVFMVKYHSFPQTVALA